MARNDRNDATARPRGDESDDRQAQPRRGLEGKGFDAGGGYGGAGNDSLYSGERGYGGQAQDGGNTMRGAYAGGAYGRQGDGGNAGNAGNAGSGDDGGDAPGAGASNGGGSGVEIPRGTDEHSGSRGQPDSGDVPARQVDPESQLGAGRREPGR